MQLFSALVLIRPEAKEYGVYGLKRIALVLSRYWIKV